MHIVRPLRPDLPHTASPALEVSVGSTLCGIGPWGHSRPRMECAPIWPGDWRPISGWGLGADWLGGLAVFASGVSEAGVLYWQLH